jgi:glutamine phosphoribosylpyrophosphate amidotransferase
MCVIIDKDPGATVPFDKLEIACRVNAHGHGISYIHRGKLQFDYCTQLNDPQAIADKLARLQKRRVFLHLRFATVGDVTLFNAHPFPLLSKKLHGVDVGLMHNGTLGNYRPTGEALEAKWSDTKFFSETFAKPLAERCLAFGDSPLEDVFFVRQIQKESGTWSVLVLFDSLGNTVRINEERGAQFDGWWASTTNNRTKKRGIDSLSSNTSAKRRTH